MLHITKKVSKTKKKKLSFSVLLIILDNNNNSNNNNKDTNSNDFVHVSVNFQTGQLTPCVFTGVTASLQ